MSSVEIEYVQNLLSPIFEPKGKIDRVDGRTLVSPGENFTSVLWAIEVYIKEHGENKCLQVAAKVTPRNQRVMKQQLSSPKFQKEIQVYEKILPALSEFQKSYSEKKYLENIAPKYFGGYMKQLPNNEEQGIILLENLLTKGYTTLDKCKGLNLDCAKAVLRELAKFHAVPIAYKTQKPALFNEMVKPYLYGLKSFDVSTLGDPFEYMMNKWNEFAKYVPECELHNHKFRGWIERFIKGDGPELVEQFATVSHNDLWINNILFKFVDGECEDVKIVDYQVLSYESFAKDLFFFLFVSLQNDVLEKHYDELMLYYYNHFICTLDRYGMDSKSYTFDAMMHEFDRIARSGAAFQSLAILGVIFQNPLNVVEVEKMDYRKIKAGAPTKEHIEKFRTLLKIYLEKNYI